MRRVRVVVGLIVWIGLLAVGYWSVERSLRQGGHTTAALRKDIATLAATPRRHSEIRSETVLRYTIGDPVFAPGPDGGLEQIGEVTAVFAPQTDESVRSAWTTSAEVVLYRDVDPDLYSLVHYTAPDSLAATLQTMLPPAKRMEIADEIRKSIEANRSEIVAQLKPVVERSLRESVRVVEQELAVALRKHRDELTQLGAKYQRDIVNQEIIPLVREEVLPIVRKRAQPLAEEIGKTLWDRVSIWGFGWRFLYDKSPLPRRDRVQKEWNRFVNEEVVPELESRSDEIVAVVQQIFTDAARNDEIRSAFRRNLSAIVEDPEVHRIVWRVFREVMIESPRVRDVLERTWSTPQAKRAFRLASDRFEPTAVRIGELLFGTPDGGITPEFAAVLRRRILLKDKRWLVLTERGDVRLASATDALQVASGGENDHYPGRLRGSE